MKMGLSAAEGMILHGLLEEAAGDIVVKLDKQGFIIHASANFAELGFDLSLLLLLPHVTDLAERSHDQDVSDYTGAVLSGRALGGWVEFPAITPEAPEGPGSANSQRWYALSLRPILDEEGEPNGAIGLMRSVQHLRALEGELHASVMTDPLTGLANRHAFCASLRRHLTSGGSHTVAIFAIDRMRALYMQYGQRTADDIQWGFAKFLDTMILPGQELAQLDEERFAVIMPEMTTRAANAWADDVLETFASLAMDSSSRSAKLSASAGIARIECTVDWTLRQAELALVMARAGGGMRVGKCRQLSANDHRAAQTAEQLLGVAAAAR
ncbi:diguanylate cyclase [uncultured Erythrobacter sp.]|uniref:sensor domain-containing diguanylate cyclase n=2 Tax=uncultured Erythrobacter sp. TaxID=263913 RepID=UPI00260585AC|nr:diguanylate cyclase [uncultured Erythrobacter sp.]